ncbi:MAG: hypothetical protein AB7V46_19040 [Thermomicrobiales bacterium]
MADVKRIPDEALRSIAAQIAERLPPRMTTWSLRRPRLAESLPIHALDEVPPAGVPLSEAAQQTPFWHHQIHHPQGKTTTARSMESDGAWKVMEVGAAPMAMELDAAIDRVDLEAPDDWDARLLLVPDYHVAGIWLHSVDAEDDLVSVVARPAGMAMLEKTVLYSATTFLMLLRDYRPSLGVPIIDE